MKLFLGLLLTSCVLAEMSTENCPSGWTMVKRTMGNWCIQVFAGTVNVREADQKCREQGAVLTGMENEAEKQLILAAGVKIIRSVSKREGSIWLGGRRRVPCLAPNTNATGCVPWVPNAFEWTDGFTTGKTMLHKWRTTQPDYYKNVQDRICMLIVDGKVGSGGTLPGDLEDAGPNAKFNDFPLNCMRGYACGKKPTITNYI
ncbi:unnamed protein product [Caenorhabditis angaria]|uniref:C-type lectin domain-containing protein n=1 Tax=Caenorhabditis angaria TaxID=860376 RepID=A0A9P1N3R2_9PELO|nr:unnamed protein product [Caenorhabditis angaria]